MGSPKTRIDAGVVTYEELLCKTTQFAKSKISISSNYFKLPEFQRNFIWGKPQIKRLVRDIREEDELFMGNIVTASEKNGFDFLIDGQQRLVTLSILLLVLRKKTQSKELIGQIDKLIYKNTNEPRLTFSKQNLNKFYIRVLSEESSNIDPSDDIQKYIKKAVSIASKEVLFLSTDEDIIEFVKKISKLNFVVIKCLNISELSKLYVGLNSTGVELSQVELVKGYLYNTTTDKNSPTLKLWKGLERKFEKEKIFLFNQFLRHQWFLTEGHITAGRLSEAINSSKIKKGKNILKEYLLELKDDSDIYIKLRKNNNNDLGFPGHTRGDSARKIPAILDDIFKFGLQQVYPVILSLHKYGKTNLGYHKNGTSLNDFTKLWSFLLLAKYTQINPSKYEKLFAQFCFDVTQKGKSGEEINDCSKYFFRKLGDLVGLNRDKFIKEFNSQYRDNEDKYTKVLFCDIYNTKHAYTSQEFVVEHILPLGKKKNGSFKHWKQLTNSEYEVAQGLLFRLGNLSILESNLNESAGDQSFEEKIVFYNQSLILENRKICAYDFSSAQAIYKSIDERGKQIAGLVFDTYLKNLKNEKHK